MQYNDIQFHLNFESEPLTSLLKYQMAIKHNIRKLNIESDLSLLLLSIFKNNLIFII